MAPPFQQHRLSLTLLFSAHSYSPHSPMVQIPGPGKEDKLVKATLETPWDLLPVTARSVVVDLNGKSRAYFPELKMPHTNSLDLIPCNGYNL